MKVLIILLALFNLYAFPPENLVKEKNWPVPKAVFSPENYLCHRTDGHINIDGKADEQSWQNAPWTGLFTDIEGELKPEPYLKTRVKMLWDEEYMYFFADMEEPHLWATLTERDAVVYFDNDFEIFIDPDGDTHNYYELEFNAHGTLWDLLLTKPYRDNGHAVDAWDVRDIKYALDIRGTLNDPSDTDEGWSIEVAIPWKVLEECAGHPGPPKDGEIWKVNFSRVQWETEIQAYSYVKKPDTPEHNWVWSPQGLIAMHYPEMWGNVRFAGTASSSYGDRFSYTEQENSETTAEWLLRQLYYGMKYTKEDTGVHPRDLKELYKALNIENMNDHFPENFPYAEPEMHVFGNCYIISMESRKTGSRKVLIKEDGKVWKK
ncbi:MAG TPA: carbohydrate-binding family 9-like protein [Clostridiales bacterium]|nr:carbohydrate-binding family 9-like protein [Clostridiales bacterium]